MYVVELPVGPGEADVVKVEVREVDEGIQQVARPGQVVARAGHSDVVHPLRLRPDEWINALCRMLGGSDLSVEERRSQLVAVPAEPVCP